VLWSGARQVMAGVSCGTDEHKQHTACCWLRLQLLRAHGGRPLPLVLHHGGNHNNLHASSHSTLCVQLRWRW
jgi:hypothetical protein